MPPRARRPTKRFTPPVTALSASTSRTTRRSTSSSLLSSAPSSPLAPTILEPYTAAQLVQSARLCDLLYDTGALLCGVNEIVYPRCWPAEGRWEVPQAAKDLIAIHQMTPRSNNKAATRYQDIIRVVLSSRQSAADDCIPGKVYSEMQFSYACILADRRLDIRVNRARGPPELELWSKDAGLLAGEPVAHINMISLKLPNDIARPSQLGLNEEKILFRDIRNDEVPDRREVCIGTARLRPHTCIWADTVMRNVSREFERNADPPRSLLVEAWEALFKLGAGKRLALSLGSRLYRNARPDLVRSKPVDIKPDIKRESSQVPVARDKGKGRERPSTSTGSTSGSGAKRARAPPNLMDATTSLKAPADPHGTGPTDNASSSDFLLGVVTRRLEHVEASLAEEIKRANEDRKELMDALLRSQR